MLGKYIKNSAITIISLLCACGLSLLFQYIFDVREHITTVNMANIRKKLGDKPGEANYIVNELGVGYRLN